MLKDSIELLKSLIKNFYKDEDVKVYLFGSRAKGNNTYCSDVDIAIEGKNLRLANLRFLIDESNVPYKVDIVDLNNAPKKLKEEILKTGIRWI